MNCIIVHVMQLVYMQDCLVPGMSAVCGPMVLQIPHLTAPVGMWLLAMQ
jgi:hypothetical protein